jgi:hypothetical protein
MASKRSRKIISDDEENYKPRKQLKTSIKSEEILLIVKIFKQDIISYNKTINRIENSLDNQEEFIYDECSELKRNIQLETEEIIAKIKQSNEIDLNLDETKLESDLFNLIQNVIEQSQTLITTIDDHEKVIKSYWIDKQINKKLFIKDYNKLKQFSDLFIQTWTKRLDDLNFDDVTMNEAVIKLNEYQTKLNILASKIKMYLFNNNCIELRRIDDKEISNRLNYFLYYKQHAIFNQSNKFYLHKILDQSTIQMVIDNKNLLKLNYCSDFNDNPASFEVLKNGKYLVLFQSNSTQFQGTYIAIFDPVLNKLEKEKFIEKIFYEQINFNHNLIAMRSYSQNESNLVVMNYDLEVVNQIPVGTLRGADDSFIYTSDILENGEHSTDIKVVDWSLETVKTLQFQCTNRMDPFFYDIQYSFSLKRGYVSLKFLTNIFFLKSEFTVSLYNENGSSIKTISCNYGNSFKLHNENIVIFNQNENKLSYYDSKVNLVIKEINLINIKLKRNHNPVKFDSNDKILIFDFNLKCISSC